MNRDIFYNEVRASLFGGKLSGGAEGQFKGLERLLDTWEEYYAKDYDDRFLARTLATSFHETGKAMWPIMEKGPRSYFNKYDIRYNPKKARELGNTSPGDGYKYRGGGDVQNTGKRNAKFASDRLNEKFGLNVDLVKNPEKRLDSFISAHSLFLGNIEGWWTGRKLTQYITKDRTDFHGARRVVNAMDKAKRIEGYAYKFLSAINKARGGEAVDIPIAQVLRPKSKGWDVMRLQTKLKIPADGIYGSETKQAVIAYQLSKDLTADGVAGPNTLKALRLA